MKNIIKMRIIHDIRSNPIKEYILDFFKYIGLMVHDEIVDNKYDWNNHLSQINDNDGVDVILNYFGDYYNPYIENRVYLYFDLERGICEISQEPLENPFLLQKTETYTKRELRIKVLSSLINEIWAYDEVNCKAIEYIKDCYVPKDEDRDLFYVLQTIYCYNNIINMREILRENERIKRDNKEKEKRKSKLSQEEFLPTNLDISDDYVKTMFVELWRMYCLLENNDNFNDNPYISYTKINAQKLLLILYSSLYELNKEKLYYLEYNGKKLLLENVEQVFNLAYNLFQKYPWFTTSLIMLDSLNTRDKQLNEVIYRRLINDSQRSNFPAYYSNVYYQKGLEYIKLISMIRNAGNDSEEEKNIAKQLFQKALELDPHNYRANYELSYLIAMEGNLKHASHMLREASIVPNVILTANSIDKDRNYIEICLSFKELINKYEVNFILNKISLSLDREFSMRHYTNNLRLLVTEIEEAKLVKTITDETEKPFQEFIEYHQYSLPVWLLYIILEPWAVNIINDEFIKETIVKKLSRWKSD